jgi:argininosuccinate lyase
VQDEQQDATDAGRLWGGRFSTGPDEAAWQLGVSTSFDRQLWRQDLAGSKAHAGELHRIGVLDEDEHERMVAAIDRCAALFADDAFAVRATPTRTSTAPSSGGWSS